MKKVVVIGANGYLGYQLTKYLVEKGLKVVALVPQGFDYSNVSSIPGINCVDFLFGSLDKLDNLPALKDVDSIYNMAWIGVNATDRNNDKLQLRNISCNVEVVEFAKRNNIRRIIIPGSAAQYACSGEIIDGTGSPAPSDLYSAAKVATYYYCNTLCTQYGIEFIWALITSIYGSGRDDNNLLSYVIKSFIKGEKPSTTNLEQRWDYLYIDDLMSALYLLGERGIGGKIYPVGSGENKMLREYVEIIRDTMGTSIPIGYGEVPYKNNKIDNQILDITAIQEDTGFMPKYTFEEGIKSTISFFESRCHQLKR